MISIDKVDSDYQVDSYALAMYLRYLNILQNLTSYFKQCMKGGADDMVQEALYFIRNSTHWEHAFIHLNVFHAPPGRLDLERQLLELAREHAGNVRCSALLELIAQIENHEQVSLQKRDEETAACPHADRDAVWAAEVDAALDECFGLLDDDCDDDFDDDFDDPAFLHRDLGDHDDPLFWH